MPRPTATMRSACERSTACLASWNGASGRWRIAARVHAHAGGGDDRAPGPFCTASARNAPICTVTRCGAGPWGTTSATSLPWNIGRANAGCPSDVRDRDDVGDQRAVEPRGQRRHEVARLIGVRQHHELRRLLGNRAPRPPGRMRPACRCRARSARRSITSATAACANSPATAGDAAVRARRPSPASCRPPAAAPPPRASQLARLSLPSFCSAMTRITAPSPPRAAGARAPRRPRRPSRRSSTVCFDFCGA